MISQYYNQNLILYKFVVDGGGDDVIILFVGTKIPYLIQVDLELWMLLLP